MPNEIDPAVIKNIRQRDAQALASGYTSQVRWVEICSIVTFFGFLLALGIKLWGPTLHSPYLALCAIVLAYIVADFISGLVHWLADTWGHPDMPVIGKALIRPFREHHVDQEAITHHDFVETNGNNCLVSLPAAAIAMLIPVRGPGALFGVVFLTALVFWVFCTNQFHKWSHMQQPPRVIGWLQALHLVLPPGHHCVHHTAPFDRYYCITVGWLNWPLHKVRFFRTLEWMVTVICGLVPRQDDIGDEAARAIAPTAQPTGSIEAQTRVP